MSTTPQWQHPGGPVPVPPTPRRPWYRKKRIMIPAGLILLAGIGGALSDPADSATSAGTPATTPTSAPLSAPASASPSAATPASASTASTSSTPSATVPEVPPAPPVDPFTEQFGTFATVKQSGTGDSVITLPATAALVTATHKGSANFVVETLDASNQMDDLLVNTIGKYSGVVSYGLRTDDATTLKITADGAWSVQIAPIAGAPVLTSPSKGTGDAVYRYEGPTAVAAVTHSGTSNFAVLQSGGSWPNLLINEIGTYKGSVPLTAGPSLLLITADDAWTITTS